MLELGPIRFDPVIIGAVVVVGALAVGTVWLLRDVLQTAPEAAFPLLLTVLVGGMLIVAYVAKRR